MGKNGKMLLSGGAPLAGAAIIRALDAAH